MPVSGEQFATPPATPQKFEVPEGMVLVKQSEHDAVQGDLRRTRSENTKLKGEKEDRERQEQQDAAAAAGQYDTAVGVERTAREKAEAKASKALLGDAITNVLLSRNYTGEQAVAIKRLVVRDSVELDSNGDPLPSSVVDAVDAVVEQFPNLFSKEAPPPPPPGDEGGEQTRAPRRAGPATPPPDQKGAKPEGYVSIEEYMATPMEVRYTDAFRARVAISEPYWPKQLNRSDLQQDAS